jgi:putative ABC transport system substrate-binding protein
LLPLQKATRTIPLVFVQIFDPVAVGYVANLTRPNSNITGFTLGEYALGGKMLELLKKIASRIDHVAIMLNPDQAGHGAMLQAIEGVAPALGVRSIAVPAREAAEIDGAMETAAREPSGGLVVLPNPVFFSHREQITALAARYGIPAVYGLRGFVTSGGLVSYSIDGNDQIRRAAGYIDRILRGATVAELPVQQPTTYELAINLKTAKGLGLEVPPTLLATAETVIE